jgi:hypothetical protein
MTFLVKGFCDGVRSVISYPITYFQAPNYENKYLYDLKSKYSAFIESLRINKPEFFASIPNPSFNQMEHLANLIQEEENPQFPQFKEYANQFLSALNTYRENQDKFIDQEIPGATTYEKFLEVKRQCDVDPSDKNRARLKHFEHRLEQERLSKDGEEGAYAKVLKAKKELHLAKSYFSLRHPVIQEKSANLARASHEHSQLVSQWKKEQEGTIAQIFAKAFDEKGKKGQDPFIWEGRCVFLKLLSSQFYKKIHTLTTNIDILEGEIPRLEEEIPQLEGRIRKVDPSRIGESQSTLSKILNFFLSLFWTSPDAKKIDTLVSDYHAKKSILEDKKKQLSGKQDTLNKMRPNSPSPQAPASEETSSVVTSAPAPVTKQMQLINFLKQMPLFNDKVEGFISRHLQIPDDAHIQIDGNKCTITMREAPKTQPIDKEKTLTPDEFQKMNRQIETENLRHIEGAALPQSPIPIPGSPKIKDLKSLRSIGPRSTQGLLRGATLSLGKKITLEIEGNTVKFLDGGPQIHSTLNAWVNSITVCELRDAVSDQELGKVKVGSVARFNVPLPSSEYFLSDVDFLLSKIR